MLAVMLAPHAAYAQVRYLPPIDEPVVLRSFAPPDARFGSGHRGVDFAVTPGTPIRAIAQGTVTFAGAVAAHVWVSIAHPDGHVSTYGPLTDLRVGVGDTVTHTTTIGRLAPGGHGSANADQGLHLSLRYDTEYRDPFTVVPRGGQITLVGESLWMATGAPPRANANWGGGRFGGLLVRSSEKASLPYAYHPPNSNHLVIMAGLATSSESQMPDPTLLGYDEDSVTRVSYAGLDEPYGPEHTWAGPEAYVERLEATLRAIGRREPGRAVDIVVHSQAGRIALRHLLTREVLRDPTFPPIGNIIMVASPVNGSDLAAAGQLINVEMGLGGAITELQRRTGFGMGTLPLNAPAIGELDPRSTETQTLARDWQEAWEQAASEQPYGPLVLPPQILSIAGAHDPVVAPGRTRITGKHLPEAANDYLYERVLPGGHGSVKHTDASYETMWRFLAGEDLVDSPGYLAHGIGRGVGGAIEAIRFVVNDLLLPRRSNTTGCFGLNRLLSRC